MNSNKNRDETTALKELALRAKAIEERLLRSSNRSRRESSEFAIAAIGATAT